MSGASLGNSLISTTKKIADDAVRKQPANRKSIIKNVDNIDYKIDADVDLPVGDIVLSSRSIVTPYAGDGYGFICSPRENQSVIAIPIDNDHNKSVIIGRTYDNDIERPPVHNLGDVILRHQLGHQWSFTYEQPVTGELNLDVANQVDLELDEEESTTAQLKFNVTSASTPIILPGQIIRVVLEYESTDELYVYLTVNIEWEAPVEHDEEKALDDPKRAFIIISDANTIVGGPLYQSQDSTSPKHYKMQQYQDKYFGMILSPPKGKAQFSHYMGMGIFMEEYPDRVPIGSAMSEDGRFLADGSHPKSFTLNTDSFLDETLDEFGYLNNFPRGAIVFKHYSESGLSIQEKARKTYDLEDEADEWNQSALGLDLSLIRQTPKFKNISGLDDQEKPLASLLMEDDCKNSYYNAVHMRIAHDNTGVQRISDEEIVFFDVQHLVEYEEDDEDGIKTRIENSLPGTRPSRLQFYDLKRTPNYNDEVDVDKFICFHDDGEDHCKLNLNPGFDPDKPISDSNPKYVSIQEQQATYESGREEPKLGKKKCPHWPGCVEGHYTHQHIDIPLAIRNTDIRVDNIDLLMKPKANAEFAHYTSSGLFFEEQLPVDDEGNILYDKIKEDGSIDYDSTDLTVRNFHAPVVDLRLREWNYLPLSAEDLGNEINYLDGSKSNAHEPKRHDLLNLKFETIYGDRRGGGEKGNYHEDEDGKVSFIDEHAEYKTAIKMFLGQNLYGNLLPDIDDNYAIQMGSRLLVKDLLDDGVPVSVWAPTTSVEDPSLKPANDEDPDEDRDTRVIFPKGKLELMHYTNSGLLIEEQDKTTAGNLDVDYSAVAHRMAMSLRFNYWSANSAGDDQYRPVNSHSPALNDELGVSDEIDPMGIIKWHETGTVIPSAGKYADDETSFVDFFIYQNALRAQHITKDPTIPIPWWKNGVDGEDTDATPTGAYVAIRESDNAGTVPRTPVVEITDTKNSIKMDSKLDAEKIEIVSRKEQFKNDAPEVNRILMDSMHSIMKFINGFEGEAEDGNNSIVMNKDDGSITITDVNKNVIVINGDGIVITDTVNTNEIKMDSNGITISAGGSTVDVANNGDIDLNTTAAINITGAAGITVSDPAVVITGGTLKVDGVAAPTGTGGFCGIPACVFSGALHTGNMISGT